MGKRREKDGTTTKSMGINTKGLTNDLDDLGGIPVLGDLHICHHPTWENREENVGRRSQRPPRPTLIKSI